MIELILAMSIPFGISLCVFGIAYCFCKERIMSARSKHEFDEVEMGNTSPKSDDEDDFDTELDLEVQGKDSHKIHSL
jgi:hypothetical protein